jgi:hypothetical protein
MLHPHRHDSSRATSDTVTAQAGEEVKTIRKKITICNLQFAIFIL